MNTSAKDLRGTVTRSIPTLREIWEQRGLEETANVEAEASSRGMEVVDLKRLWEIEDAHVAAQRIRTRGMIEGEIEHLFPDLLGRMTFDTFEPMTPPQREAKDAAIAWVAAYAKQVVTLEPRPRSGMLLNGRNGRGKTHIIVSMLRALTSPLVSIDFVILPLWLQEMRESFGESGSKAARMLQKAKSVDLLAIDDLGQESRTTPFVVDTLGSVVFHRHAHGLATLYSTNMSLKEIGDRADGKANAAGVNLGAIYSRIRETVKDSAYYFDGVDFRASGSRA